MVFTKKSVSDSTTSAGNTIKKKNKKYNWKTIGFKVEKRYLVYLSKDISMIFIFKKIRRHSKFNILFFYSTTEIFYWLIESDLISVKHNNCPEIEWRYIYDSQFVVLLSVSFCILEASEEKQS